MWRLGWQVFRARLPEVVSARDRRRLVVVGAVVTPLAVAGLLVVAALTESWSTGFVVVAGCFGLAIGGFSLVFCRIGPKGWTIPALPTVDWRTQEQIARYSGRRPPAVVPEHRDAVLRTVETNRDVLVRSSLQGLFLLGSWLFGVLGAVALGVTDPGTFASGHGFAFLYAPLWPLLGAVRAGVGFRTLGRHEQLRREASVLPDPPPAPPKRGRPGAPGGSKLALPGEDG